jgi:signal peptidase II
MNTGAERKRALRNRVVFCVVVVLWFLLDRVTKLFVEAHPADGLSSLQIDGIVGLSLVHNYGAAWGSFSGMVSVLVVLTALLCLVIFVYALFVSKEASLLLMIGLSLVFAGGIGNLFDRLVNGYVIDFIAPLFIDFPTFNIADIGITCGIICVVVAMAIKLFASYASTDV